MQARSNSITRVCKLHDEHIIHFITYGDEQYARSKARICKEAAKTKWFRSVKGYGKKDLTPAFRKTFKSVLSMRRGGGYWIWKYDIILQRLSTMKDGEILVYLDSGCTVNIKGEQRFSEYIEMLKSSKASKNIISFQMEGAPEKCWTTKEIFQSFSIPEGHPIRDSGQFVGGILIMRKCDDVMRMFINCLQLLQSNPLIITDVYNQKGQSKQFRDNRHDQSISSVMRKKRQNSIVIPDETWFLDFSSESALKVPFLATRLQ